MPAIPRFIPDVYHPVAKQKRVHLMK